MLPITLYPAANTYNKLILKNKILVLGLEPRPPKRMNFKSIVSTNSTRQAFYLNSNFFFINIKTLDLQKQEDATGFEPVVHYCTIAFKTTTFNHSATHPTSFYKNEGDGIRTRITWLDKPALYH